MAAVNDPSKEPNLVGLAFCPSRGVERGPAPAFRGGETLGSRGQAPPIPRLIEKELMWRSGCLSCLSLLVPYHPQAFWGLEFTAACREEPFLPANERELSPTVICLLQS